MEKKKRFNKKTEYKTSRVPFWKEMLLEKWPAGKLLCLRELESKLFALWSIPIEPNIIAEVTVLREGNIEALYPCWEFMRLRGDDADDSFAGLLLLETLLSTNSRKVGDDVVSWVSPEFKNLKNGSEPSHAFPLVLAATSPCCLKFAVGAERNRSNPELGCWCCCWTW